MAKVLPSHHYKMPAGEDWKEIFHDAFGQEAWNVMRGLGEQIYSA